MEKRGLEPVTTERWLVAVLDPQRVCEERHKFDPAGPSARPDVLPLAVHRQRQRTFRLHD